MWPNFTEVKYNSKLSIIYHQIKISKRYNEQVFYTKAVLKNFATFAENHLRWSLSFKIKMQAFSPKTLSKRGFHTGFSCEYCEIFKKTCFGEHL